jgi:hypothetical protein
MNEQWLLLSDYCFFLIKGHLNERLFVDIRFLFYIMILFLFYFVAKTNQLYSILLKINISIKKENT